MPGTATSAFDGPARALTSAAGVFQAAALTGPSVAGVDARYREAETERGPRGRGPLEAPVVPGEGG